MRRPQILAFEHRFIARLQDGRKVFFKVLASENREHVADRRGILDREEAILKSLSGLAVPEIVKLPRRLLPLPKSNLPAAFICQTACGDGALDKIGLDPRRLTAAWLFVAEQLAAFRRREIVYRDVKCGNVVARRRPFRVHVVDFGGALSLRETRRPIRPFFTMGFAAPEVMSGERPTEASFVYELGMLLPHILCRVNSTNFRHPKNGIARVERILDGLGALPLSPLIASCLEADAEKRPSSYEVVLQRIKATALPDSLVRIWKDLREPYAQSLSALGLTL